MMYILGEDKIARIQVSSQTGDPFYIKEAWYDLKLDGTSIDSGECNIDHQKQIIYAQLAPKLPGAYQLEVTYHIGPETFKNRFGVIAKC